MKRGKLWYWITTGLMAAFMLMSAIPDIMRHPEAEAIFTHLGYPLYFLPFIGVLKVLGVVAILVPGFTRLKEWAYAGLVFDLIGAIYSHLSVGDPVNVWGFPVIALVLVTASYYFHRNRIKDRQASNP
jgi:uncharacterized membrane protein YphA (DoxX/SURF4 family)